LTFDERLVRDRVHHRHPMRARPLCTASQPGACLRRVDSCITQLKAECTWVSGGAGEAQSSVRSLHNSGSPAASACDRPVNQRLSCDETHNTTAEQGSKFAIFLQLPTFLKLTNTDPFAAWFLANIAHITQSPSEFGT